MMGEGLKEEEGGETAVSLKISNFFLKKKKKEVLKFWRECG